MEHSLVKLRLITQNAAAISSDETLIRYMVSAIRESMAVGVCSLYLKEISGDLLLVATEGLDQAAVNNVRLKVGEGLVGVTALNKHPLNIKNASAHPAFKYFAQTHEEKCQSFMGVPLVYLKEMVGVLVVQGLEAKKFSDEEEAFLITIAAQLAGIASRVKPEKLLLEPGNNLRNRKISGIKGASGVGIGNAHWVDDAQLEHVADRLTEDPEQEITLFRDAIQRTRSVFEQLSADIAAAVNDDVLPIFSVYQMLIESPEIVEGVENKIREGNWAQGALRATIKEYAGVFDAMSDPYLRARAEDIRHIGNKLYLQLKGENDQVHPLGDEKLVLCGDVVSVTDIARFHTSRLAGIVCTAGSSLSHTAVLANALGIPAVMGTGPIADLSTGDQVVVDGYQAQIIVKPIPSLIDEYNRLIDRDLTLLSKLVHLRPLPAISPDNFRITLYSNTGLLADISPGLERGAEGIGLYRSEIPFLTHDTFPTEDEQVHIYRHVLSSYAGKPVYMRTLDIGGDKPLPYYSFKEENPSMGWRGIRFTLDNVPILMTQLRAMLRASEGLDNLHIILPMVSRLDELLNFRSILDEALKQIAEEGGRVQVPSVGIMVEVPSAISLLEDLRPHMDFISIGSNDLSQYLLAVDRNNPRVSGMFDKLNPAVIREINQLVIKARGLNLPTSLCGEMASFPQAVLLLMGMGVQTLSMSAYNLPKVKWLIRTIPSSVAVNTLQEALRLSDENQIRKLTNKVLSDYGLAELIGPTGS